MAIIQTSAKTVTAAQAIKFVDAVCATYGYRSTIPNPSSTPESPLPDIPNPITRNQFAQTVMDDFVWTWGRNLVISYNRSQIAVDTDTGL